MTKLLDGSAKKKVNAPRSSIHAVSFCIVFRCPSVLGECISNEWYTSVMAVKRWPRVHIKSLVLLW